MEKAIKSIIEGIGKGTFFDSHYIIDTLIKKYSDYYLVFASENLPKGGHGATRYVHGKIAKAIEKICHNNNLAERISDNKNKSISHTIHSTPGKCALWKRK